MKLREFLDSLPKKQKDNLKKILLDKTKLWHLATEQLKVNVEIRNNIVTMKYDDKNIYLNIKLDDLKNDRPSTHK